ncbi:MAG: Rne/Rng family ribonuclease [Candidatus Latescibacteria bacterium]|nr:Rne/Rng family ribonuclease [Candidatus Latescibacterota bacterium]
MRKDIIVEAATHETRIAILEDNQLVELMVERPEHERIVGNICKGIVTAVLPSIQAAFVDIGMEKAAFLHASDIVGPSDLIDIEEEEDGASGQSGRGREGRERERPIQEMLREGQEVLVQITKESIGTKGPRVTAQVSLPGRFLVLVPNENYVGVSRRIEDWAEKRRLRELAKTLKPPDVGVIVRTAALGKTEMEFQADLKMLSKLWNRVSTQAQKVRPPAVIHKDMEITSSFIRDLFTPDIESVVIDSKEVYKETLSYLRTVAPQLRTRVHLYEGTAPIFDAYGIESEIEKALHRKVWLKHGGYIVIDHTEALVSIDVNSGRYAGSQDHEQAAFQTNLEAAREIARQLKLRDNGGIIVIDFIDMEEKGHRRRVLQELQNVLKRDRARTRVSEISEFGLIEMTRQRVRPSLLHTFSEACPICDGTGRVMSRLTVVTRIGRWLKRAKATLREKRLRLTVHPSVAQCLYDNDREKLRELEKEYRIQIDIVEDPFLHVEEYRVFSTKRDLDITDEFKS